MRRVAAPLLAFLALAGAARAQTAQRPPEQPPMGYGPEIVVRPRPKLLPAVVATYPAQGAAVASGTLVLKVVFNQDMTAQGWSYAKAAGVDFPACLPRPRLLPDGRTFVLLCATSAGRAYAVGLNADPPDGFADPARRFAARYDLRFTTLSPADAEPVRPIADALRAAGLGLDDSPIMSWQGHAGAPEVAKAPSPEG